MHSKYTDLSNVVCDILSIIPQGVSVEASFALGWNVIGCRQSKTTGKTIRETLVVRQFASANHRISGGADPELNSTNTENDSEMKKEAEERKVHRMAKVHYFLEMRQGSQNLRAMMRKSHAQTRSSPPWDTFRTWKKSSKHPGHSFNMMVWQHLNCQKYLLCHHLCLQRTSLEQELKY